VRAALIFSLLLFGPTPSGQVGGAARRWIAASQRCHVGVDAGLLRHPGRQTRL